MVPVHSSPMLDILSTWFSHIKSRKTRGNHWLLSTGTRRADREHQLKHQVFLKKQGGLPEDNCVNMESFACMRGDTVNGFQCHTVWEVKGGTLQKPFMQDTVSLWGKSVSSSPGQQRICHSVNQKSHIVSSWTLRKSHYCFHYCTERRSNHQSSWLESGFTVPVTPRGASWSLKQGCMAYNHSLLYFKPYLSEGTGTHSISSYMMQFMWRHHFSFFKTSWGNETESGERTNQNIVLLSGLFSAGWMNL